MHLPRRNAASALEDAASHLAAGMEAARRGRHSLPELRALERSILRTWAAGNGRLFSQDPTLSLERRQLHGEHAVAYDPRTSCWWKTTHPGKAGVGVEFLYDSLPPFEITGVSARELLPSEYLERLILHNNQFGDDIRFEGFVDADQPSLLVSQTDVDGTPATQSQMEAQMILLGFQPLTGVALGKPNSISFYHPLSRIAVFDAHPGNFFQTSKGVLPIDGIITKISHPMEHQWLMDRIAPTD